MKQPADEKCDCCHGRHCCLLPVESDNGHPACTECLISSHGCPNHVACTAPVRKKPTCSTKGKVRAGPSPVKHPQAFVLVPCLKPSSRPTTTNEPTQPEAGPSTMPTALDFMVEFQSFCSRPMQERPTPGHGKFSVSVPFCLVLTLARSCHRFCLQLGGALPWWIDPPQGGSVGPDPCPHAPAHRGSPGA